MGLDDVILKLHRQINISRVLESVKCLVQQEDQVVGIWIHLVLIRWNIGISFDEKIPINLFPRKVANGLVKVPAKQRMDNNRSSWKHRMMMPLISDAIEVGWKGGVRRKAKTPAALPSRNGWQ